jgi:hypothetical protein
MDLHRLQNRFFALLFSHFPGLMTKWLKKQQLDDYGPPPWNAKNKEQEKVGWRITEVSARYRKHAGGTSKVSGTLKDSVLAGYKILWTVFRYTWRAV